MADPANKTFEDFEKSTQGGGQSECPLGYGSSPKKNQSLNARLDLEAAMIQNAHQVSYEASSLT